jgi:hypothetical protein
MSIPFASLRCSAITFDRCQVCRRLVEQLHEHMPEILAHQSLQNLWAYKYDANWRDGIDIHADQALASVRSAECRIGRCAARLRVIEGL